MVTSTRSRTFRPWIGQTHTLIHMHILSLVSLSLSLSLSHVHARTHAQTL